MTLVFFQRSTLSKQRNIISKPTFITKLVYTRKIRKIWHKCSFEALISKKKVFNNTFAILVPGQKVSLQGPQIANPLHYCNRKRITGLSIKHSAFSSSSAFLTPFFLDTFIILMRIGKICAGNTILN